LGHRGRAAGRQPESFDNVLTRIRLLDGIANTETSLLLSTRKL
jgi:hypothetical protein